MVVLIELIDMSLVLEMVQHPLVCLSVALLTRILFWSKCHCYIFIKYQTQTYLSFCLIFPYHDPSSLSPADYIGLPCSFLLSLITPIFDHPLYYLVAVCLSFYQYSGVYLVRYIDPQSGGTALDYVPSAYLLYSLRVN